MRQNLPRSAFRVLLQSTMALVATPLSEEELRRSAIVFAPHPDDETLGCGGTILRKRRAGADVQLVFMTDGAACQPQLSSRAEMRATRRAEALEAAGVLGVEASRVTWLDFPDGSLDPWRAEAVVRVRRLLQQRRPRQIFLPYAQREHADHVATHAIVYEALSQLNLAVTLFEYPVWSWRHWPTSKAHPSWRSVLTGCRAAVRGARFLRELRTCVDIQDVLGHKRAALNCHVSQMERRNGHPGWSTLGDVDGGEFLASLLSEHEYYRRVDPGSGS